MNDRIGLRHDAAKQFSYRGDVIDRTLHLPNSENTGAHVAGFQDDSTFRTRNEFCDVAELRVRLRSAHR